MALADGKVTQKEMRILLRFGKKLGWVQYDIQRLIAQTRKQLYKSARKDLKRSGTQTSTVR